MDIKLAATAMRPFVEHAATRCPDHIAGGDATSISHIRDMIEKIESGEIADEKAHRWLGWIQGVTCCYGGASLDEMKLVNFAA
jgi:hypothetical protein